MSVRTQSGKIFFLSSVAFDVSFYKVAGFTDIRFERVDGLFGFFHFGAGDRALRPDHVKRFFHDMLKEGVCLAPSAFEARFVSSAYGDAGIAVTSDTSGQVFAKLK